MIQLTAQSTGFSPKLDAPATSTAMPTDSSEAQNPTPIERAKPLRVRANMSRPSQSLPSHSSGLTGWLRLVRLW